MIRANSSRAEVETGRTVVARAVEPTTLQGNHVHTGQCGHLARAQL